MGGSIHSFVFPPSLYIFPDLIISFFAFTFLNLFSFLSAESHFILTIIIFQIILIGLFYKIQINQSNFKSKYRKKIIYDSCVLGISLLNLSLIGSDRFLDLILFTNHSGVVLLILLFLLLYQNNYNLLSLIVVFIGCFSDPLFVGLIILFSIFQILFNQKFIFHLILIIVAIIGYAIPVIIKDYGWLEFGHEYYTQFIQIRRFNWKNIHAMLNIWIFQFRENLISSTIIFFLLFIKYPTRNRNLDKGLKLFVYANLIIAICYTTLAVYLPLRYLPILAFYLLWRIINSQFNFIKYIFVILIFSYGLYYLNQEKTPDKNYIPRYIKSLEEIYYNYPDSEIYLDYWYARPVYVYSKIIPRKNIYQIDKNGKNYNWISEKKISSTNKTKINVNIPTKNTLP